MAKKEIDWEKLSKVKNDSGFNMAIILSMIVVYLLLLCGVVWSIILLKNGLIALF